MMIAGKSFSDKSSLALAGPGAPGFGEMNIAKSGPNASILGTTS